MGRRVDEAVYASSTGGNGKGDMPQEEEEEEEEQEGGAAKKRDEEDKRDDNDAGIRAAVSGNHGRVSSDGASQYQYSAATASERPPVRRPSLPVVVDSNLADDAFPKRWEFNSAGNSPALSPTRPPPENESEDEVRRPHPLHKALPSLHLNACCLKCDRVGTVYCKGCEAHFCAKHDQRRHRFMLRSHEHEGLPGISYFRLPLPSSREGDDESPNSFSDTPSDDTVTPPRGIVTSGYGISNADSVGTTSSGGSCGGRTTAESSLDSVGTKGGVAGGGRAGGRGRGRVGRGDGVLRSTGTMPLNTERGARHARRPSRSTIDLARSGWYDKIVMAIVRPPRCTYSEQDLGPVLTPLSSGLTMKRKDFVVQNRRGLKLMCSQWRPAFTEDTSQLPCVVYLHGNSSARVDVVKTRSLTVLGAAACTVVAFDFSGSGMSEGDWVTLGYFEQHDVADVLAYLRSNGMASRYLLWGRSMGAASALLYAERYANSHLCGLILDSPFCSFKRLARDLVTEGQVNVPGFLVNGALGMLRRSVRKRTRCDLKTVAPIVRAKQIRCPSLFIAARKDVMVRPSHGADLSEAVGGASLFITCRGAHNTSRPGVVLAAIGTFVKGCFRGPDVPITEAFDAIQVKLAEAQALAAELRRSRLAAAANADRNRSGSGSKSGGGSEGKGRRGSKSIGDGSQEIYALSSAPGGMGRRPPSCGAGGGRPVDSEAEEAGKRGSRVLPPFAPALALRSRWKDASPTQQDMRTTRVSSDNGKEARPSSLASSQDSGESYLGSGKPSEQQQPRGARASSNPDRHPGHTRRRSGAGGSTSHASPRMSHASPREQRLPSWRDTIFHERPKRGASLDGIRVNTGEISPPPTPPPRARIAPGVSGCNGGDSGRGSTPRSRANGCADAAAAGSTKAGTSAAAASARYRAKAKAEEIVGRTGGRGRGGGGGARIPASLSRASPPAPSAPPLLKAASSSKGSARAAAHATLIVRPPQTVARPPPATYVNGTGSGDWGETFRSNGGVGADASGGLSSGSRSGSGSEVGHIRRKTGSGGVVTMQRVAAIASGATTTTTVAGGAGGGVAPSTISNTSSGRGNAAGADSAAGVSASNVSAAGVSAAGVSVGGATDTTSAGGKWWGRIRIKTPMLYGFRKQRDNNSGSSGVTGFTDQNARGMGDAASRLSCEPCETCTGLCTCSVVMSMENDGVPPSCRRVSHLRTASGKLKM